jgi:hypothetical protein
VSDEKELATEDLRKVEEHLARKLFHYFTGLHPPGLKFEDQPPDVRELWLGAARVAIETMPETSA